MKHRTETYETTVITATQCHKILNVEHLQLADAKQSSNIF